MFSEGEEHFPQDICKKEVFSMVVSQIILDEVFYVTRCAMVVGVRK